MSIVKEILAKAVARDASDVHLKANSPPFLRVRGTLVESGLPKLTGDDLLRIVQDILPAHLRKKPDPDMEMDFSHFEEGVGRFRVNVFMWESPNLFACPGHLGNQSVACRPGWLLALLYQEGRRSARWCASRPGQTRGRRP